MKRKIISIILLLSLASSQLIGCNNKTINKKQVTLSIAIPDLSSKDNQAFEKSFDTAVANFKRDNPNIKLNINQISGNYSDEINKEISNKTAPDLFFINNDMIGALASSDKISPLDDYLADEDMEDFQKNILDSFTIKGKTYALPLTADTMVLYYNKTMLNSAGFKVPTTWNELLSDDNSLKTSLNIAYSPDIAALFMLEAGGKIVNGDTPVFNSSECIKGLDFYRSIFNAEGTGSSGSSGESNITSGTQSFGNGGDTFCIGMSTGAIYMQNNGLNWGMTTLLAGEANSSGLIYSNAFALSNGSSQKREAVDFIKYFSSKKIQELLVDQTGIIPVRKSVEDDLVKKHPDMEPVINMLDVSTPYQFGANHLKIVNALNDIIYNIQNDFSKQDKTITTQTSKTLLDQAVIKSK